MAWYSYNRIRSYNALFNFIVSNRGGGKTYGFKEMCIKDFLKNGQQFIYVRRFKTELKEKSTFFDDILEKFPDHNFYIKGSRAFIDDKVAGYFIPLSVSRQYKSVAFPMVTKIGFDEFIIDKESGTQRYLTDEVTTMLELCSTVIRKRDNVRVFFMGNNISLINPYFTFFKCIPKPDERFTVAKNGELVIELFADTQHIEDMKNTKFGELVSGTLYEEYAIENKSLRDNQRFIYSKLPTDSKYLFSVTFNDRTIGFWISYKEGNFYVNKSYHKDKYNYSLTKSDHNINMIMCDRLNNFLFFREFVRYYRQGYAYFSNNEVKMFAYEIMLYMGIK